MRAYLTYVTYRLIGALVGRLPPRVGYWLANRAGVLLYTFYPGLRQIVTDNLRHVLGPQAGEPEVQAMVRQACTNIAKGHYELFRLPRLTLNEIGHLVEVQGMKHIDAALARGRGIVVTSAHVGNVDIVSQFPATYGLAVVGAAEHIKPERLFRYLLRVRQKHGLRLIPSDEPMLPLFRALKRGGIVALPSDRDVGDHGQVVEFFGSPTRLPDGPVRVALRTGAALIPAFVSRLPSESFVIQVEPALDLPQTEDMESDVTAGLKMVVAAMERHIARDPAQWLVAASVWPQDGSSGAPSNGDGNRALTP